MLYFTESGWTLPNIMKVNEDSDREYDQDEYEHKIARLITKADKRIRKGSRDDYDRWWAAIRFLQREDHYILVMIRLAGLRPRGDQLRLLATGLTVVTVMLIGIFVSIKYDIHAPFRGDLGIFVWVSLVCLCISYMLLRFIIGGREPMTSPPTENDHSVQQDFRHVYRSSLAPVQAVAALLKRHPVTHV